MKFYSFSLLFLILGILAANLPVGAEEVTGTENSLQQLQMISQAFQETSRKVIPSVVKIVIKHGKDKDKDKEKRGSLPLGDILPSIPEVEMIDGIGSGVLVDSRGIVLTNNHVVADSDNIMVELYDGRQLSASSIKKDPQSDLAVVTLNREDSDDESLPCLSFADSDKLEIGDWVLAIGNPFMLQSSVSAGIISAKKRFLDQKQVPYIQTDAAVNPGNSGGPLVNLNGEVIGINTAIVSLSGGNQGIGFAIPSNTARWIMNQLIEKGKVERAFLGAPFEALKYEDVKKYGLAPRQGVRIGTPYKDSPAADAGLHTNDIICAFDGTIIDSLETLQMLVESADVQKEHQLTIIRQNEKEQQTIPIHLKIKPDNYVGVPLAEKLVENGKYYNDRELGLMMIQSTPKSVERLGLKDVEGLVVLNITPGSIAYRAGIRSGMLIVKLNGQPIPDTATFAELREKFPLENGVDLEVMSRTGTQTLTLKK